MLLRGILYPLALLLCILIFAKVRARRVRQAVLLIVSYALYISWGAWFAAVLLASTVMNYLLGKWLRRKRSGLTLSIGILLNLALLSTFKYLPEAAVQHSSVVVAMVLASCVAPRNLVLDLPGHELPV